MEVHSANLANSNMPGFKRVELSSTAFSDQLESQVAPEANLAGTLTCNHSQGALRSTGRPLDFAIEGDGFFVVSKEGQEFYTRNGGFQVDADGRVVNSLGMTVQTTTGDLQLPLDGGNGPLEIDEQFNVRMDGNVLGTLKIASVEKPQELESVGNTLFKNNGAEVIAAEGRVMNGFLEQSNAVVVEEMVGMMATLRNYEACQRMLRTVDDADQKMLNKLT